MGASHGVGSDLPGTEFGPYEIVRRLGVGGMAETFEAIRRGPQGITQHVCLKVALPALRDDQEFVRLFQREARLAAKLRHSNIVGVVDYGNVDDTPYIAFELVHGVDLLTLLTARGPLPFGQVALLAVELAKGLDHAHNLTLAAGLDVSGTNLEGVIHRDVSPSNILLSQYGEVMLTDFGVAKALSAAPRALSATSIVLPKGRVKGKVPYMAPEQLRNEPLDGRTDLFGLGVVLFEALTGERPFGGNEPSTIMRILKGEHIPLCEAASEAPQRFCEVIDRLLEPERELRPTASAFLEQLDEFAPTSRVHQEMGLIVAAIPEEARYRTAPEETYAGDSLPQHEGEVASGVKPKGPSAGPSGPGAGDEDATPSRHGRLAVVVIAAFVALGGLIVWMMRRG